MRRLLAGGVGLVLLGASFVAGLIVGITWADDNPSR